MNEQAIEAVAKGLRTHVASDLVAAIYAQAALTAYHAWLEANGFAVVPVEPSEAMVEAGWLEIEHYPPCEVYRAMIAASKGGGA